MEFKDEAELNKVISRFRDCFTANPVDSIVVDVRFNSGGSDAVADDFASCFVNKETLGGSIQIYNSTGHSDLEPLHFGEVGGAIETLADVPVVVLTIPMTASAGETFVLFMRALDNVSVVGSNTMGILSDQSPRILPNGWCVTLSNEARFSHDGNVFESRGVPVDEEVGFPFAEYLLEGKDPGIDKALELITQSVSSHHAEEDHKKISTEDLRTRKNKPK